VGAMVITRRAWDKLPSETQASLRQLAEKAGEEIRRNSRNEDTDAVATMRDKHHLQVHALPAGAETEWRDGFEKIYPKLRGAVVPGDLFDEVVAALAEFRSRNSAAK
jgi:TRAP-type C4-dicarboxylate transport system substrate-binding protein